MGDITPFDQLLADLATKRYIEDAAAQDVIDRKHDADRAKAKLHDAEQALCHAQHEAQNARIAIHSRIEIETHSPFEDEPLFLTDERNE